VYSSNHLISTVGYRLNGNTSYAIEGSIFMAGATLQWLRDNLGLIKHVSESESLARQTSDYLSVYLVPAFTGLGAPHWDPNARAALYGMTRDTGANELITAGLMSTVYQTKDLVDAITSDGASLATLRVDGGLATNNYFTEKLADLLNLEVYRPATTEITALGAAYVAGLHAGIFSSLDEIGKKWEFEKKFIPQKNKEWRDKQHTGWKLAVQKTLV
jgi:glycerol kinase